MRREFRTLPSINPLPQRRYLRLRRVLATTMLVVVVGLAGGCGDVDSSDTIALSDWVTKFEQTCADVYEQTSAPALTDEEFMEISVRAITDMRAIGEPDEMADVVADLLDALESNSDQDLDDASIEAKDQRVLTAMASLGVEDACAGGAPGE